MNLDMRFELGPYWGTNRPAFPLALTTGPLFDMARRYGRVTGLRVFRDSDKNSGDVSVSTLALQGRPVFNNSDNAKAKWIDNGGHGNAYLKEFPNAFQSEQVVLSHTSTQPAAYMSNPQTGFVIPKNSGFMLRLYLEEPGVEFPVFVIRWGRYQLMINAQGVRIMRASPAWTQSKESDLIDILATPDITEGLQVEADALIAEIYRDYQEIDLGSGDGFYNNWFTLVVEPEGTGYLNVSLAGKTPVTIPHTEILKTRRPGVMWDDTPLTIKTNGGIFSFQAGYTEHGRIGEARIRFKTGYFTDILDDIVYTGNWYKPPGTDIIFSRAIINSVWAEIVVTLKTSNRRVTPFLYAAQAYIDAGERSGGDCSGGNVVLDTDDLIDDVITEMNVSQEGEDRRLQIDIQSSDVEGEVFTDLGFNYEIGQHRTANVYAGGVRLLKNGIVTPSQWQNLKSFTTNQARVLVTWPETIANFTVHSQWYLLEEFKLKGGELIGDGMYLGGLFRRCLRLIGTPYARMSNVGANSGPYIAPAAPGETWAEVNEAGTLADYMRYLLERYAYGEKLWEDNSANWYFSGRSTSVIELFGHPVHFTSDPTNYDPDSYPGRFAILAELDLSNSVEEFFNDFSGIGAGGYNSSDEPLIRTASIAESISSVSMSPKRLGRRRTMDPATGNWRTPADLSYGMRCIIKRYGGIPNFRGFITHFIPGLYVSDRVLVDGIFSEMRCIEDAPVHDDEMVVLTQRLA